MSILKNKPKRRQSIGKMQNEKAREKKTSFVNRIFIYGANHKKFINKNIDEMINSESSIYDTSIVSFKHDDSFEINFLA